METQKMLLIIFITILVLSVFLGVSGTIYGGTIRFLEFISGYSRIGG